MSTTVTAPPRTSRRPAPAHVGIKPPIRGKAEVSDRGDATLPELPARPGRTDRAHGAPEGETEAERRRRRVQPRRAKAARVRHAMRMRRFRR
ncbi:hypothetical protein GCM10011578_025070 [Streptomyces fuscichromogenes]|uniref:Uncharacterized protein n=1 Tax=Streptomyces fuscichromogenes TaxID=1324013 RepID=A0A917XAR5_9ACTN|nr:hypothetical protein GCM10011578_025070 [Streptomyces fuscichromogenes]